MNLEKKKNLFQIMLKKLNLMMEFYVLQKIILMSIKQ